MDCKTCKENLVCYVEDLIDQQQRFAIEQHLKQCKKCEFEAKEIAKIHKMLTKRGKEITENIFLEEKVLLQIKQQKTKSENYNPVSTLSISIRNLRKNFVKYIAAASIAIIAISGFYLLGNSAAEADFAWERVAGDILKAKTAIFDLVVGGGPTVKNIVAGQYRKQILGNGAEIIADYNTGQTLILNNNEKIAYFADSGNISHFATNYFQYLKDKIEILKLSPDTKVVYLGIKNVNDSPAQGLHIYNNNVDLKIWTDTESDFPALIIYDKTLGQSTVKMTNFQFNIPVEELALSMEVPETYTVEPFVTQFISASEQDLIKALDIWTTTYSDGRFPQKIACNMMLDNSKLINKINQELGMTDKEKMETALQITRGLKFIDNLPLDSDWQYTGKGVTTKDKDAIIFRYKPENSNNYRVIYGDLTVEEEDIKN